MNPELLPSVYFNFFRGIIFGISYDSFEYDTPTRDNFMHHGRTIHIIILCMQIHVVWRWVKEIDTPAPGPVVMYTKTYYIDLDVYDGLRDRFYEWFNLHGNGGAFEDSEMPIGGPYIKITGTPWVHSEFMMFMCDEDYLGVFNLNLLAKEIRRYYHNTRHYRIEFRYFTSNAGIISVESTDEHTDILGTADEHARIIEFVKSYKAP